MKSAPLGPTFRDPAGSLSFEEDRVVRTIHPDSQVGVLEFLDSSFCRRAQLRGELIPADIDLITSPSGHALRLLHPRIPIPTYPWEWTPTQWLAAADLTLNVCQEALADGWILKDATPLNILFIGPHPIFVDILSFECRAPHSSIWLAYGQYIRSFLLPLISNRLLHWPLALTLFKRDGYEPADLYAAMSWPQRLSRAALWPITLPTLLDRCKSAAPAAKPTPRPQSPDIATAILTRTLNNLRRSTQRALPAHATSDWCAYTSTLTHYTPEQTHAKLTWVTQMLESTTPTTVLDIGANTGEFSALAASLGASVTALERDAASADRLHRMASDRGLAIQTIHADLARPTPAVGWQNAESAALLQRLTGRFDLVLMLAVIHHLILMEQIPIPAILALAHSLTQRHLILEWVPVEDPMFQSLMRGRDTLYGHLTEANLLQACTGFFHTLDRQPLANGRTLFLFEKIA